MADAIRRTRHKTGPLKGKFKTIKHAHAKKQTTPHTTKSIVRHAKGSKAHAGKAVHKTGKAHAGKASRKSGKASRKNGKASRKNGKASRKNGKASRKNGKASRKSTRSRSLRPRKSSAVDISMPTLLTAMPKRGNRPMMVVAAVLFVIIVAVVIWSLLPTSKPGGTGAGSDDAKILVPDDSGSLIRTVGVVLIGGTVTLLLLAFLNRTRIRLFIKNLRGGSGDLDREVAFMRAAVFESKLGNDQRLQASYVIDSIMKSDLSDQDKRAALRELRAAIQSNPSSFAKAMKGSEILKDFFLSAESQVSDLRIVQRTPLEDFWRISLDPKDAAATTAAEQILNKKFPDSPNVRRSFMNQRKRIHDMISSEAGLKVSTLFNQEATYDPKDLMILLKNQKPMLKSLESGGNAFFDGVGGTGKTATVKHYIAMMNQRDIDAGNKPSWRQVDITRSKVAEIMGSSSAEAFGSYLNMVKAQAELDGLRGNHTVFFMDEANNILNDKVLGPIFKQSIGTMPKNAQLVGAANVKIEDLAQLDRFGTRTTVEAADEKDLASLLKQKLLEKNLSVNVSGEDVDVKIAQARDFFTKHAADLIGRGKKDISSRTMLDLATQIEAITKDAVRKGVKDGEQIRIKYIINKDNQLEAKAVKEREMK
jgi:preprotein translocase subunit SecG